MVRLHTENQLDSLPGSASKVCVVVGGLKVTLVFCFGPNPKFCSFHLDLDQAEQFKMKEAAQTASLAVRIWDIIE